MMGGWIVWFGRSNDGFCRGVKTHRGRVINLKNTVVVVHCPGCLDFFTLSNFGVEWGRAISGLLSYVCEQVTSVVVNFSLGKAGVMIVEARV